MEKAASPESEALYLQRVQESVNSGKRSAKLRAADFGNWKTQSKSLGASGLARGAQKGNAKVVAHFQKWGPIYQQASDAAQSLPKGGIDASMARCRAAVAVMMAAAGRT
jgi:hypothetical protein